MLNRIDPDQNEQSLGTKPSSASPSNDNVNSNSNGNDNDNANDNANDDVNDNKEAPPKSRRKLGRAARRRKSKIRAIRQSVQLLLTGTGDGSVNVTQDGENHCLPTDRNRSLPGVLTRRREYNDCDNSNDDDNNDDNGNASKGDGSQYQTHSQLQCNGLTKNDESMLTSQLGFIPGNGISVVSRVKDVKELYPCLFKLLTRPTNSNTNVNSATATTNKEDEERLDEYPIVLQLYPLVTRDIYNGGKSDGRKFKSRKRGHSQIVTLDENDDKTKTNDSESIDTKAAAVDKIADTIAEATTTTTNTNTTTIEPFPTMYWLTHPHLKALISQLEIEQNVKTFEQKITSCPNNLKSMHDAHESYGKMRWSLLTDEDKKDAEDRRWVSALGTERGVAGIRNFATVKCLHAHGAHYLAYCGMSANSNTTSTCSRKLNNVDLNENLVGKWTLEAVEKLIVNGGRTSGMDTAD